MRPAAAAAVGALCLASATAGFGLYWLFQDHAPDVAADFALRGLDGNVHRLSEWNGRVRLVNFWATWCAPCLTEIPLLVQTHDAHAAHGLTVIGVALDDPALVQQFRERYAISYPLLFGEVDAMAAMDALGDRLGALPFSVLIGRDGQVLERMSGALTPGEIRGWLDEHLPD